MDTTVNTKNELKVLTNEEINKLFLPGEIGLILDYRLFDTKTHLPVSEHIVKKSESFVKQFLQLLYMVMQQIGTPNTIAITDTGNVSRNVFHCSSDVYNTKPITFDVLAGAGVTNFGIVVGTGSTAPTINDNALQTLIVHGSGSGQLSYGAITFGSPASDSSTSQFTITRNFTNSSGGAINVNEIGLYCRAYDG